MRLYHLDWTDLQSAIFSAARFAEAAGYLNIELEISSALSHNLGEPFVTSAAGTASLFGIPVIGVFPSAVCEWRLVVAKGKVSLRELGADEV